jgi:hypothetical protein
MRHLSEPSPGLSAAFRCATLAVMRTLVVICAMIALMGCKAEKDPSSGVSGGPTATAPTQSDACDKLLKNDKGEYSAGKCVCDQVDGQWTCRIGN